MRKIIYGNTANSGIFKLVEKNLAYHGFEVISLVNEQKFRYPNLFTWLKIKLNRLFGDRKLKKRLEQQQVFETAKIKLASLEMADYSLFFCGHIYNAATLELVKQKTRLAMVNLQQDGINRYPDILSKIGYFDRFYVSDPKDLAIKNAHFLPATNFYFDFDLNEVEPIQHDFYFLGVHVPSRQHSILAFSRYAKSQHLKLKFDLYCEPRKLNKLKKTVYTQDNINLISHYIDYAENLKAAKQAKVLVDFVIGEHKTLSYRVFEALGYNKKLITTNHTIKYYDFYHPNNIFIWDGEDLSGLVEFLNKPFISIAPEIKQKYSFGHWINYILDIHPHTKISLPDLVMEKSE